MQYAFLNLSILKGSWCITLAWDSLVTLHELGTAGDIIGNISLFLDYFWHSWSGRGWVGTSLHWQVILSSGRVWRRPKEPPQLFQGWVVHLACSSSQFLGMCRPRYSCTLKVRKIQGMPGECLFSSSLWWGSKQGWMCHLTEPWFTRKRDVNADSRYCFH